MRSRTIIAATDGTGPARAAVAWAAREAEHRGLPLRIVHVYENDRYESRFDIGNEYTDVTRSLAEAVVADAADSAREIAPHLSVETGTLTGHPAARLLEASRDAELLVIGTRGRGGVTGLMLGSVSARLATHAHCPVVVVRGRHGDTEGHIVLGVDDDPAAEQVLGSAFELAAQRGVSLLAVRAYLPVLPLWVGDVNPAAVATPEQDAQERASLDALLKPWRDKYPEVPVGILLSHESPAAVLTAASRQARLVVVGSRGHGLVAGELLGSTGLHLLHHADCPVLIVRPEGA